MANLRTRPVTRRQVLTFLSLGAGASLLAACGGGGAPAGTQEAGALFRSCDTGESWERVDIGDTPPSRMAQVAIDRNAPAHVYCCAQRGQVYMSHDSGQTWQQTEVPVELSRSRHIYPMVCG